MAGNVLKIKTFAFSLFFFISTAFICEAKHSPIEDEMQILRMFYQGKDLVISATRHPKPVSQVAENITVITAKEIERMNAHTISDVLNRVPGIFLRNFNQDFGSPARWSHMEPACQQFSGNKFNTCRNHKTDRNYKRSCLVNMGFISGGCG